MTRNRFWEITKLLNYQTDLDYVRIGSDLINNSICTYHEAINYRDEFYNLYNDLENKMNNDIKSSSLDYEEIIGLGDDGLGDLISHVIGLGFDEYNSCYCDILKLSSHANGNFNSISGYTESFSYAFLHLENQDPC